uniref:Xin actin-binding repeat-containing protein 1-like n=1 Tax=Callorhinchus milii TaxID=7868 RepID=A0A4W3HBN6_CALMI
MERNEDRSREREGVGSTEGLPPPPPDPSALPLPPPPQSLAQTRQQRQINELKRLYRHMRPELRKNMELVLTTAETPDLSPPGEVQSMRWIFENWPLDIIGDHQTAKRLREEETVPLGDVRGTSQMFEAQNLTETGDQRSETPRVERGDVRTALWLFETQPMDSLNKVSTEEGELQEAVLREREAIPGGDVSGARLLFETQPLHRVGRSGSAEERSVLQLRSEIQELSGGVSRTVGLFETEPLCAIREPGGVMHRVRSVCREEIQHSDQAKSARWLFETQPLGDISGGEHSPMVRVVRGISLEEEAGRGTGGVGVGRARWLFETQPLDAIRERSSELAEECENIKVVEGGDVRKWRSLFESKPLDSRPPGEGEGEEVGGETREAVTGGDVRSTLWLFETQPMDSLRDSFEVGQLRRVVTEEEKGDVKQKAREFESRPLEVTRGQPGEEKEEAADVRKGDVKAYQRLFESLPLDGIKEPGGEMVAIRSQVIGGNVRESRALFENPPRYAIADGAGGYHQVRTVSREEEEAMGSGGDVRNYRWVFETQPLDRQGCEEAQLVKGITKEEAWVGDVGTARWLFETQPLRGLAPDAGGETEEQRKSGGEVKTCRWLFETPLADARLERAQREADTAPGTGGDVRRWTWLFETPEVPGESASGERSLKVTGRADSDTGTAKHLFDSEPVVVGGGGVRYTSKVDVRSGDVSREKEIFERSSLDAIGEEARSGDGEEQGPEPGAVRRFTWLFENRPMDAIGEMDARPASSWGPGRQEVGPPAGQSVRSSLRSLCAAGAVRSGGLAIESCRVGTVSMVKYRVAGTDEGTNRGCVGEADILKEEVIHGNLQRILVELLDKTNVAPQGILLREDKDGRISSAKVQFFSRPQPGAEQEAAHSPDLRVIHDLLRPGSSVKKGILIQESGKGEAEMTVYSLLDRAEAQTETRGRSRNVQLIASCVDAGDLDSLKKEEPVQEKEKVEEKVAQRRFEEIPGTVNTKEVRGTKVSSVACSLAPEIQGAGEARVKLGRSAHVHRAHRPCLGPAVTVSRGEDSGLQDGASGASEQQLQVAMEGMREATAQAQAHGRSSQHRAGVGPSPALSPSRSQQVSEIAGDRGGGGGGGLGRPTVPATARCQS